MNIKLMQRQLVLNAQVLSGLYEEYAKLCAERLKFNKLADESAMKAFEADNNLDFDTAKGFRGDVEIYEGQAALYTPFIKKFKRKIAKVEQLQKALKHAIKCAQCVYQEEEQPCTINLFDDPYYFTAYVAMGED